MTDRGRGRTRARSSDAPTARLAVACRRRRAYFTDDRRAIVDLNLRSLRTACLLVGLLALLFIGLTCVLTPGWLPDPVHFLLIAVCVLVAAVCPWARRALGERPWTAAALCLGSQLVVLALVAYIDGALTPDAPGTFMQAVCIAWAAVIVLPWAMPVGVVMVAEVAYVALSFACKDFALAQRDLYGALVGASASVIVSQLATNLRVADFEARERYRNLSLRDGLLGIYNKGALTALAQRYFESVAPHVTACVIMLDIDDFKAVNDRFGHDTGDEVLRALAGALQRCFRSSDAVGRFGGDEFMVLARGLTDPRVIAGKLDAVRLQLEERCEKLVGQRVECSAGAVILRDADATYETAFRQADEALYAAKRAGKARVVIREFCPPAPVRERRASTADAAASPCNGEDGA